MPLTQVLSDNREEAETIYADSSSKPVTVITDKRHDPPVAWVQTDHDYALLRTRRCGKLLPASMPTFTNWDARVAGEREWAKLCLLVDVVDFLQLHHARRPL